VLIYNVPMKTDAKGTSVKNHIEVSAEFDFRGKTYTPSVKLDLDSLMEQYGEFPDLHQRLAREINIGPYSYEYEVLESSELIFSNATGFASKFLTEKQFDIQAFRQYWLEQQQLNMVQEIASRHLDIDELEKHPNLKAALIEAYTLGKQRS